MSRPYDYIGIRDVFIAQALTVVILVLSTPLNMMAGRYDSGGVISNLHLALWSVATVAWLCVGGFLIVGLTRMRNYSLWFWKAWRMMLLVVTVAVLEGVIFGAAVMLGPMQMREGLAELEQSYRTYWLYMVLLGVAAVMLVVLVVLGLLFNRVFLWGCAEISSRNGHLIQAATCKLLFPMGLITMVGGLAAVGFYYYQSLNSVVDSRAMGGARLDLMIMGGLWGLVQLMVMGVTWRTWRIGEEAYEQR